MDGADLPAIPGTGRLAFPGRFLSFLGFLVVVRYSFLIIHAVDQVQASPPAMSSSSITVEHEQLLAYYLVWMLGLLVMLVPPLIANSPRQIRLAARRMNSLFPVLNPLRPIRLMDWLRVGLQFASFLGFLITVRYSFLIIHAVDQVQASPPTMSSSTSFTVEHEQLLAYYLVWTLGLLTMLLPPLIANSPRLMPLAARVMNSLFPVFDPLPPIRLMDWLRFGPQFASFLGFLVTVRYSFLIIHAVNQVHRAQASPPVMSSSSFTPEHEQLLEYYLAWTLGLLAMLLPPLFANSQRLMSFAAPAMNSLYPTFVDEQA